ncbi:hypothetical protein PLESTB_001525300 [Pleodorina starrii]|uniref:FAS1 domain-containing protein n=1 Tax=Pleodorina starrii TaxID=330485 RepID=A0A9W6BXS3_9CHLO|nr:hypothetical protein PLESTB_001525300 [Pleodorina starrii]GLC75368.1 hypothetical protein PLESTF_001628600 [Pleodorina starrii]
MATTTSPPSSRAAAEVVGSWAYGAAVAAGLDQELLGGPPSTVFVPSDEAVKAYIASSGAATADLATDRGKAAVAAHVVPNVRLTWADFPQGDMVLTSRAGTPLTVTNTGGLLSVRVGDVRANVVKSDLCGGNSVIHIVDRVLADI